MCEPQKQKKHILICGKRGVGKSTLVQKLLASCRMPVYGFRTKATPRDENGIFQFYIHPAGNEQWFYLKENHIGFGNERKRQIDPGVFASFGVSCLQAEADGIILMDELGFMESESKEFCSAVMKCLDGDIPVLATVKERTDVDFLDQVRRHPNAMLYTITEENRDELYRQLLPLVLEWNKNI